MFELELKKSRLLMAGNAQDLQSLKVEASKVESGKIKMSKKET